MFTGDNIPKRATANISPYRLVRTQANNGASLAAASTDPIIGVSTESAATNGHFSVQTDGVATVEAGAAVAVGADVTCDSVGRGITASPATGINAYIIGKALTAASVTGDFFDVQVTPSRIQG
ncbi:MAG: capsid cement protein [Trueperaceae bacterium]